MKPRWWITRVIDDRRLPIEARVLLAWLGTRPAGWRYSVDEACQWAGVERKKYQRMLAALKAIGYVEAEHKRDPRTGRVKYTKLTINDCATEGAKGTFRTTRPRVPNETLRTEGGNSTHTSLSDRDVKSRGEGEVSDRSRPALRVIGGRDA